MSVPVVISISTPSVINSENVLDVGNASTRNPLGNTSGFFSYYKKRKILMKDVCKKNGHRFKRF